MSRRARTAEFKASDSGMQLFGPRVVRLKDAAIHHFIQPDGSVRRFVVLNSRLLRQALGQPRRKRIEDWKPPGFMRTSELWEQASQDATRLLRKLYVAIGEARAAEAISEGTSTRSPALPGKMLKPIGHDGSALGVLIYAGPRTGEAYCIDLLDEDCGEVRRIKGIDLARALEACGAEVGDRIRVVPTERHSVTIQERREGVHGDANTSFRLGRKTFDIVVERELRQMASAIS